MPNFRTLIGLFREHQRAALFVETAVQTDVSLLEMYVLVELDKDPALPIKTLAYLNNVDENSVARAIRRLRKRRMIASSQLPDDARRRVNVVTDLGRKALHVLEETSKAFLRPRIKALSISEIAELQSLIGELCDGNDSPSVILRASDHPFDQGIRRITRGFGFIGTSLFGSGYSSTVWQLLWAVHEGSGQISPSELHKLLGIHTSTLSQLCSRYKRSGWITQKTDQHDRRRRIFSITARGTKVLDTIEQYGEAMCLRAFQDETSGKGQRLIDLFAKYLRQGDPRRNAILRPAVQIAHLVSEQERNDARTFIVFNLFRIGKIAALPERLAPADGNTFALREGERLIAVLGLEEWRTSDSASSIPAHLVLSEECYDSILLTEFVTAIADRLGVERGNDQLLIALSLRTLPSRIAEALERASDTRQFALV
jgi:DNA-binding MarR family transcriptional regulator